MTKEQIRKQLQQGISAFLSSGKQITKCKPAGQRKPRVQAPEEEIIEIEINYLPAGLRKKHFGVD